MFREQSLELHKSTLATKLRSYRLSGQSSHCIAQTFRQQKKSNVRIIASAQSKYMANTGEHRLDFHNEAGEKLAMIFCNSKTKDAVILCHGLGSHKNGFHLKAIAQSLHEKGISSLRFDFPGCAESEGDFKYANIRHEAGCINSAYDYLKHHGYNVIGLLGHSKSGTGVLLYSATYGKVPKVVVCAGRFNLKKGVKERFGDDVFERVERDGGIPQRFEASWGVKEWIFDKEDLKERMTLDMEAEIKKVSKDIKFLIIHGTEDETIPFEDANSVKTLLPEAQLILIEGADHGFTKLDDGRQVVNEAVKFFRES